jgi:hypothetical protein
MGIERKSIQIDRFNFSSESSLARVLGISRYLGKLIQGESAFSLYPLASVIVHYRFSSKRKKKEKSCPVLLSHVITENRYTAEFHVLSHCVRRQSRISS